MVGACRVQHVQLLRRRAVHCCVASETRAGGVHGWLDGVLRVVGVLWRGVWYDRLGLLIILRFLGRHSSLLLATLVALGVSVHSRLSVPTRSPVARMLLLDVDHVIMNSPGVSIVFDLPQARVQRVLGEPFEVAIDLDLHRVSDAVDSPWILS